MARPRPSDAIAEPSAIAREILADGAGAHLLLGENGLDQEETADIIVTEAVPEGVRAFNYDDFHVDDSECSADAVAAAVASWPVMAERRVVVLRGAEGMRDDVGTAVAYAVQGGLGSSILLVLGEKLDARKKWSKAISSASRRHDFPVPKGRAFTAWVQARASRHGATMSGPAAGMLVEHIGTDIYRAASEVEKLATYVLPRTTIDVSDVEDVVGVTREDTVYELTDRIAARDASGALAIAGRLTRADQHPAYLVGVIVRHWQALRAAVDLIRQGQENRLGDVLGEYRPFIVNKYIAQAKALRLDRVRRGFRLAVAAESAIKAGWSPAETVLEGLICQLAARR